MPYERFMDDPDHITALEGERFVVMRPALAVRKCHGRLQDALRQRLAGLPASFPSCAHVTLAGFEPGTPLESVQGLVADWVRGARPMRISVERAASFPPPFQIALLQVRTTPALLAALRGLREMAIQRGLAVVTGVPVEEWVFHMSLAYCPNLSADEWAGVARFMETLRVPRVSAMQRMVEIVAFDEGKEHSGGVYPLRRKAPGM